MALWNLSVTIGNLWVLVANFGVTAFQMFFFAGFAFAAALAFGFVARTYPLLDYYQRQDE